MNWSSYIVMVWLPSYLTKAFDADPTNLSFTAFPYVMNCLSGVGMSLRLIVHHIEKKIQPFVCLFSCWSFCGFIDSKSLDSSISSTFDDCNWSTRTWSLHALLHFSRQSTYGCCVNTHQNFNNFI